MLLKCIKNDCSSRRFRSRHSSTIECFRQGNSRKSRAEWDGLWSILVHLQDQLDGNKHKLPPDSGFGDIKHNIIDNSDPEKNFKW